MSLIWNFVWREEDYILWVGMAKDQVWHGFTQTQPKHFIHGYPNPTQTQFIIIIIIIKKIFNNVVF